MLRTSQEGEKQSKIERRRREIRGNGMKGATIKKERIQIRKLDETKDI